MGDSLVGWSCCCLLIIHAILLASVLIVCSPSRSFVASPTYYAGPNGSLCALLDRLFYSAGYLLAYKPAAAVAVCRRGGASATFDRLNKYFTINNMPVVPSQYWNSVHGWKKGEATQDLEGLQTMRTLANNMAWMINKLQQDHPTNETPKTRTNFIR